MFPHVRVSPNRRFPALRSGPWLALLVAIGLTAIASSGTADDPQPAERGEAKAKADREARLAVMRERAESFEVNRVGAGRAERVPLRAEPVFRYSDQPRGFIDASLWCWGTKGRPAALAKVEAAVTVSGSPFWQFCAASLDDGPLDLRFPTGQLLGAKTAGVTLRSLAEAPEPSERPAGRLRQMKELVARFAATIHVDGDGSRKQEMRLLPSPIHRYADEELGLIDGVIFGLTTNGTNPDMLIVIELRKGDGQGPRWEYGIVKLTYAEVHIRLDRAEVYSSPVSEPKRTWAYLSAPRQRLAGETEGAPQGN